MGDDMYILPCAFEIFVSVMEHQHRLAHRCSSCENFHTYAKSKMGHLYIAQMGGAVMAKLVIVFWEICLKNTGSSLDGIVYIHPRAFEMMSVNKNSSDCFMYFGRRCSITHQRIPSLTILL